MTHPPPDKDRFICYWFHIPGSGTGYVHGYPIEWSEGQLLVRLDPNWDYVNRRFVPSTDTAKVERIIEQQYECGRKMFETYVALKPKIPAELAYDRASCRGFDVLY